MNTFARILISTFLGAAVLFVPNLSILHPLVTLAGIAMLGFCWIRLVPKSYLWNRSPLGTAGLSILLGFLILSAVYIIEIYGATSLMRTDHTTTTLTLLVLVLISIIVSTWRRSFQPFERTRPIPRTQSIPLLITSLGLLVPFFFNSFAQNNDDFLAITLSYARGGIVSVSDLRPIFPAMMAILSNLASVNLLHTYTIIPYLLFMAGVVTFWDYVRANHDKSVINWPTLFLLAAPVIAIEIFITRPQVVLLAFILPLLILATLASLTKRTSLALTGFLVALILIPFHELAVIFLAIFGILLLIQLYRAVVITKTLSLRQCGLAVIIVLPYLILLPIGGIFQRSVDTFRYVLSSTTGLQWNWWFIDSYKSIDGAQLGWPGIQALQYYLYSGLLLYLALILMSLLSKKRERRQINTLLPTGIFLAFFLFFAEVAPRLGFFFLLNRTWPYIALGSVFAASFMTFTSHKRLNWQFITCCMVTLIGLAGIIVVAKNNITQVFPEEAGAITFLKNNTPTTSLVYSTQDNASLVKIYGERTYIHLDPSQSTNKTWAQIMTESLQPAPVTTTKTQSTVSTTTTTTTTTTTDAKNAVTTITQNVTTTIATTSKPSIVRPERIYAIFSKRKNSGLYAQRATSYYGEATAENALTRAAANLVAYEDDATVIYDITSLYE